MKLNIALMISRPMRDLVMELVPELDSLCNVTVLTARGIDHAYSLYRDSFAKNDVFIFGGKILMLPVMRRVKEEEKRPCFAFDDMTGDIRDVILKLLIQDRQFDFSRTFIDIASKDNGYLGIKELLPPAQWPYFLDETIPDSSIAISEIGVERLIEAVLQKHIQLHRTGAIGLSITRVGVIVDELAALGLPFVYILPNREYIVNFFLEVISSVNSRRSRERLIGAVAICFPQAEPKERERLMARTGKSVMEFAAVHGLDFTPSFEKDALVVLSHRRDIAAMSADFSEAGFREDLVPPRAVAHIGLGSGRSIFQAKRNSLSALEISRNNCDRIYHVDENNEVRGPLGSSKAAFARMPDEDLLHVAERLRLDHVYLQKIMAFAKLGNTNRVSAEDLADYLGVTVRTANRVLNRILEAGGARVYEENMSGGRGRPRKYYELTFLEEEMGRLSASPQGSPG